MPAEAERDPPVDKGGLTDDERLRKTDLSRYSRQVGKEAQGELMGQRRSSLFNGHLPVSTKQKNRRIQSGGFWK